MIEWKLVVEEIDYSGIAELALPVIQEKLAEKEDGIGMLIGKHVPESALRSGINGFLSFLTPEQRDEIALSLIAKYRDRIIEILQNTAASKGVKLAVKELSVQKVEEAPQATR